MYHSGWASPSKSCVDPPGISVALRSNLRERLAAPLDFGLAKVVPVLNNIGDAGATAASTVILEERLTSPGTAVGNDSLHVNIVNGVPPEIPGRKREVRRLSSKVGRRHYVGYLRRITAITRVRT